MSESRLFQIVYYLLNKGEATAPGLAEKFEVSVRTIYRDIDKLSGAGIPVYAVAGYGGGIRLDKDFVLKRSILSKEDMQQILMGVQNMSAVGFSDSDPVLSKLQALFGLQDPGWMEVDYSRWGCDADKERRSFGLLKKAILKKCEICFKYYNSRGEIRDRKCRPLKLVFKDRAWYLYGYCLKRKACRMFRISRISGLELTDHSFADFDEKPSGNFSEAGHKNLKEEGSENAPSGEGKIVEVELSFIKEAAYRIYDVFDESLIKAEQDCFIVKAVMPEDEWLFGFLMSFGDKVTVLRPDYLKDELKKRFQAALGHLEE